MDKRGDLSSRTKTLLLALVQCLRDRENIMFTNVTKLRFSSIQFVGEMVCED